jgi:quinol monooxygenase YgiN
MMYGMIGRITATPGNRAALAALLVPREGSMPGCLSYIVANDPKHPDALYVTEAWATEADHAASLKLPAVRATIDKARPLIAGFETIAITEPVGGIGLSAGSVFDNP